MLILDKFIVLNYPKTGSTFVREAIKEIHRKRKKNTSYLFYFLDKKIRRQLYIEEILTPSNFDPSKNSQHGGYFQIPNKFRDREILATIRHPYHRLVSMYSYDWWKSKYPFPKETLHTLFPTFPNLSLTEFIKYWELIDTKRYPLIKKVNNIGFQSTRFISMFFSNPLDLINQLTIGAISFEEVYKNIPKITFIKQENLTDDLTYFLIRKRYNKEEINLIKNMPKLNLSTSTKISLDDKKYALDYLEKKERFLIGMYNYLGFNYSFIDL